MNESKLLEYLMGSITPEDDVELQEMLQNNGIDAKLATFSNQLENMALAVPEVQPSKQLKESIFAHIEQSGSQKFVGLTQRIAQFFKLPIQQIEEILETTKDVTLPVWEKAKIEGAYLHHFQAGGDFADAHCGLIYLKPSTKITEHEHLGKEYMLIIQGEVTTSDGKTHQVGEVAVSPKGSSHTLVSGPDCDCIFAVIAIGGVEFKDLELSF